MMSKEKESPILLNKDKWQECETCVKGKFTRADIPKEGNQDNIAKQVGERIVLDSWGPTPNKGPSGEQYALILRDQYSGYITVFTLKLKSDAASCISKYINMFESQTKHKIKCIRFDNAKEFYSDKLRKLYADNGIRIEKTHAHSSFSNGLAERSIRFIIDGTRTNLLEASLNKDYWPYAALYTAKCHNNTLNLKSNKTRVSYLITAQMSTK
jgi:IS30 family transposase